MVEFQPLFANSPNTDYKTTGVASKMLKYFVRNYSPVSIFSYADGRWSDGNLYLKMGFDFVKETELSYWYIVNGNLKFRWEYRKGKIKSVFKDTFDESLTEYENMLKRGYDRIWDCGTLKFSFSLK